MTSAIWDRFVVYSKRKWTMPPEGDQPFLFVFGNRQLARKYIKGILWDRVMAKQKFRVCRCKVRNLTFDRTVCYDGVNHNLKKWNFPEGTMFADTVKLI